MDVPSSISPPLFWIVIGSGHGKDRGFAPRTCSPRNPAGGTTGSEVAALTESEA
jgi:hypothetical protein